MNNLQVIKGIKCFEDENGMIQLNLENVSWGLGFTKVETKNKKEYASIRWERVFNYLAQIGFDHKGAKDIFIPEPVFYMLAMKAENDVAKAFQKIVAYEILPQIRKAGMFMPNNLSKELQAIFMLDEKQQKTEREIIAVKSDFKDFKDNSPLYNIECKELQAEVRKKGIKVLGGKGSQAYKDNSVRQKTYADIQRQLKREFGVNRYEAIKRCQFNKSLEIINNYSAPLVIADEIQMINNQTEFEKVI